ncbi:uncharacterized protein LOC144444246 [Glandiceps talaboti]
MSKYHQSKLSSWEPVDELSLSASQVQWSKTEISLEQLIEDYEFPQIIRVTQGYFDVDRDEGAPCTLQGDDIVLFHEYITQSRVVAEDKYGQHITIAKDFNYKFEVFGDERIAEVGSAGPFTIPELLERYEYPVKVRLAKNSNGYIPIKEVFEYREIRDFGDVTFTKSHTANYLIGHCLNGCDLNSYNAIAVLPIPKIKIDCVVGTIRVDGKDKEWLRFVLKLSKLARQSFDFEDFISKDNDAYLLKAGQVPEDEDNYASIKPKFIHGGNKTPGGSVQNTKIDTKYADYRQFLKRPQEIAKLYDHDITPGEERELRDRLASSKQKIYEIFEPKRETFEPPPDIPPREKLKPSPRIRPSQKVQPLTVVETPTKKTPMFVLPNDVKTLTIAGVSNCLNTLGMEKYVDRFQEVQVDGHLLLNMTKEMFRNDIGMNEFEAMKLYRFIHDGWRPNFGK